MPIGGVSTSTAIRLEDLMLCNDLAVRINGLASIAGLYGVLPEAVSHKKGSRACKKEVVGYGLGKYLVAHPHGSINRAFAKYIMRCGAAINSDSLEAYLVGGSGHTNL